MQDLRSFRVCTGPIVAASWCTLRCVQWIHSLSPRVFMMSEIDSDFNGGPFAARFHEFLMKVGGY